MLNDEEKREILRIARQSIRAALERSYVRKSGPAPAPVVLPSDPGSRPLTGRLGEASGAFVTIRSGGDLRGCIGYIESPYSLGRVVSEVAEKAALEDPRFPPLTPEEFEGISLEVSVLSPLRKITSFEEIEVGVHGLLLELGHHRGLLLPQVATEYGWNRDEFLEHTARKAGLPRDAWKDPQAEIYIFSAEIVEEEHR